MNRDKQVYCMLNVESPFWLDNNRHIFHLCDVSMRYIPRLMTSQWWYDRVSLRCTVEVWEWISNFIPYFMMDESVSHLRWTQKSLSNLLTYPVRKDTFAYTLKMKTINPSSAETKMFRKYNAMTADDLASRVTRPLAAVTVAIDTQW